MKVWITKYALTSGVEEVDVSEPDGSRFVYRDEPYYRFLPLKLGRDAYETREAAVVRAEAMRVAKIASLKKQIRKLEAMEF